jgi:hypothetical protein
VSLEDGDELGWQGNGLAAPFLDLAKDQAPSLPVRACRSVSRTAGRAQPGCVGRNADMRTARLAERFWAAAQTGSSVLPVGACCDV